MLEALLVALTVAFVAFVIPYLLLSKFLNKTRMSTDTGAVCSACLRDVHEFTHRSPVQVPQH